MPGTTDTVKAILTPGEFVIRKEAVDMIGVPTLEKLNDMPEAGGHSEIDRLIAQATLKNMTGMYGGGMVNAKQYGHGGMVNKYEDGGQAMSNLKPVPDNNPGLAKLPEDVRNKMGYMQEGGLMEMMHGGKTKKKKKMYGYQDGGQAFAEPEIRRNNPNLGVDPYMRYAILEGRPMMNEPLYNKSDALVDRLIQGGAEMSDIIPYKERKDFKSYVESGEGNARDEMLLRKLLDAMPKPSRVKRKGEADLANMNFLAKKGYDRMREDILQKEKQPMRDLRKAQEDREDILYNILDTSSFFNKEDGGLLSYQEGGAVQEDAMMQQYLQSLMAQQPQANPFVPFDQRPPSSGEVMSSIPSGMEQGDYYRSLRGELEMENEELIRDKAQNALERIKLDSLLMQGADSLLNQGAERIERVPNDSSYFQNTPAQDNFMQKFKENMLNPTYFPEGN